MANFWYDNLSFTIVFSSNAKLTNMSPFEDRFKRVNEKWSAINQVGEKSSITFFISIRNRYPETGECPVSSVPDQDVRLA